MNFSCTINGYTTKIFLKMLDIYSNKNSAFTKLLYR